jgi:hypothetical protein
MRLKDRNCERINAHKILTFNNKSSSPGPEDYITSLEAGLKSTFKKNPAEGIAVSYAQIGLPTADRFLQKFFIQERLQ